ncbi:MAG: aminotransferase class V-fold PLP-dependent enzyme, partial [Micromonospora sp.]
PEVTEPRIVVPVSAHAAFAKAAHYLRVALDHVAVDPVTLRPRAVDVAAAIRPETVLVVCSAPSYAHGVVDPVAEIAAVAASAGVRCHVDACFGGWTLPWLRRLGAPVPPFDFTVDGVTSISVDLHKYAYVPKGVSVLLHRDPGLRAPQYFAYADWPGYTMVNPVIASTRSGGPIAAAYATLRHLGEDGYLRLAALSRDAVSGLADAVRRVDGLRLMAEPESSVVCFTSTDPALDLFVLVDELTVRGWHTQPQLTYADLPASVHLTVTASVAPRVAEFGPALVDAVQAARATGPLQLPPGLRELAASLAPEMLTPESVADLAAGLGLVAGPGRPDGGEAVPARMATVNALLDAAPVAVREHLLVAFVSLLQRPTW